MSHGVARGVKKISELVLQNGRAMIITEEDASKLDWADIPDGALKVNTTTGMLMQKLKGASDWLPAGIKNDGTINIVKDAVVTEELYTIVELPHWVDNRKNDPEMIPHYITDKKGMATFTYLNSAGNRREGKIIDGGKTLIFNLENGTYMMGRHHLKVTLDDLLVYTAKSGDIKEISPSAFGIVDRLYPGQKISIEYLQHKRYGNPFPRWYLTDDRPEEAEMGDFWLDADETVETSDELIAIGDYESKISWDRVIGKPSTLAGYGIKDRVSTKGHHHNISEIDDFPLWLLNDNNSIDASTLRGHAPGTHAGNVLVLDSSGKIPGEVVSAHNHVMSDLKCFHVGVNPPDAVSPNMVWFCTAAGQSSVRVNVGGRWLILGGAWS